MWTCTRFVPGIQKENAWPETLDWGISFHSLNTYEFLPIYFGFLNIYTITNFLSCLWWPSRFFHTQSNVSVPIPTPLLKRNLILLTECSVFRAAFKELIEEACLMLCGSLFQTEAPWYAKERWPDGFVMTEGIWNRRVSEEERIWREGI